MLIAIAAVSSNWGIGKDNDLLFDIPEDKKFFRQNTLNNTVIMGRKTLESLPGGKPFKNRRNIILSRNEEFVCEGAEVCHSIDETLNLIKDGDAYVIGGGEIYKELLPYCKRVLITKIDACSEADTFFPNLDNSDEWELAEQSEQYEFEGLRYRFCTYELRA